MFDERDPATDFGELQKLNIVTEEVEELLDHIKRIPGNNDNNYSKENNEKNTKATEKYEENSVDGTTTKHQKTIRTDINQ